MILGLDAEQQIAANNLAIQGIAISQIIPPVIFDLREPAPWDTRQGFDDGIRVIARWNIPSP